MSPYRKGFVAFQEGKERKENPYDKDTPGFALWARGYNDSYNSGLETVKDFKLRFKEKQK